MKNLNLNIAKFDERKAELYKFVKNVKDTTIDGINDKVGYELADENRKLLKKKRCDLQKDFKQERAISNAYSKAIIKLEKELVGIIEPVERAIEEKLKIIDIEKETIKRRKVLPEKIKRLKEIGIEETEQFLLTMSDAEFDIYFNTKKTEYLEKKERKIKEAEEKIKKEKEIAKAKEQARKEAEKKAEQERILAIKKMEEKARREKQALIDEQKRKEEKRKADIEAKEQARKEAEKKEKEQQEELEKKKKYIKFLEKNGYTEKTKDDFYIENTGKTVILYKKVDEIKI